jgi:hypothetical protein
VWPYTAFPWLQLAVPLTLDGLPPNTCSRLRLLSRNVRAVLHAVASSMSQHLCPGATEIQNSMILPLCRSGVTTAPTRFVRVGAAISTQNSEGHTVQLRVSSRLVCRARRRAPLGPMTSLTSPETGRVSPLSESVYIFTTHLQFCLCRPIWYTYCSV